ncbi:hypothetical protein SQW19_13200 [Stenotrophomonas acidaminiphila]|uniref:hypothetical protein n=1 Tax=Stenotrophomonas acidaminiphila TaxID=128780 RepID=UPI002ABD9649|nr:hypothetical protein [Stenotrophomonas acidaminiphila]WPU55290.1 hypothetical protein SQW19_13200 [Stenotrophomonas acidaminiphila]
MALSRSPVPVLVPLLLLLAGAARADTGCPPLPGLDYCAAGAHGWVYGPDAAQVRLLGDDLAASAAAFERLFARAPLRLAVLLDAPEGIAADARARLAAAGAVQVLDWPGMQAFQAAREATQPADDPGRRLLAANPAIGQAIWRNLTRHELGHVRFNLTYWPDLGRTAGHGHARSPDWLNEAAAMVLEADDLAAHRRRLLHGMGADPAQPLPALADFLAMANPARPRDQAAPAAKGVSLVYRSPAEAGDAAAGARYYALVQGWADFLVQATAATRAGVLGSISTRIAAGGSFEDWLADTGPGFGLPATLPALDRQWQAWLQAAPH